EVGIKAMQNALNQKRAVDGALKTRLRDTPLRDATTTPTPTRTQRVHAYGNATAVARMRRVYLLSG
ncbi:MAG: hypothetical protein WBD53_11260, partial [Xanthobacteraceae bacterium]